MEKSIFIKFPWSKIPSNENFVTLSQIKKTYSIIVKAFYYKYEYFAKRLAKDSNAEYYDLNNFGVYNSFISEVTTGINDAIAREYIMDCVKEIKNCDLKNSNVRALFNTLHEMIFKDELRRDMFKEFACNNDNKFIDFLFLFKNCANVKFDDNSPQIKELKDAYGGYKKSSFDLITF